MTRESAGVLYLMHAIQFTWCWLHLHDSLIHVVKRPLAARRERKTQDLEKVKVPLYKRPGFQKDIWKNITLSAFEYDCIYMKASRDIKSKGKKVTLIC